ncbi:MAG: hypothetical protein C4567_04500 [Deltaproteobacteria bacterium]|nr:MAG: hypothetical protein C4567_04500 [Deltaproteobacteria bacterium]
MADTDKIDRYMARLFEENLKKALFYIKNDYSPRVIWFSTELHKNFEDVSSERESLWGEWGTFVNKIYFIIYDVSGDNIDIKSQAYLLYHCIGATDIWRQGEHYEMKYVLSGDNVAELDNPKMVKIIFPQAHNMT